jgi:hypothetical protein
MPYSASAGRTGAALVERGEEARPGLDLAELRFVHTPLLWFTTAF